MKNSSYSFNLTPQWSLASVLLAQIVWKLFPNVQLAGGGINSIGFFYDFIFQQPLSEGMLELIEVEMHRFIKEEHPVQYISMMRENAQAFFDHHGHPLLAEQAGEESCNILDLVKVENFHGLCPSLELFSTQDVGYVKLLDCIELKPANTHEDKKITRLVGTSQLHSKELKSFRKAYDSFLKKKDHRQLGPKLNLFSFSEEMGLLGTLWHPNGMRLRRILQDWLDQQNPQHTAYLSTPTAVLEEFLAPTPLSLEPFWFEGKNYILRSSLLRQHLQYFRNFNYEAEDLPWQINEYAQIYRHSPESQRWGLFCASAYLTDQTTICCEKKQVVSELISSLHYIEQIITIFGLTAQWVLIGSRQKTPKARQEQEAIDWFKKAFEDSGCQFSLFPDLLEEEEGETPRIELRIRDAIGREWPASGLRIVQAVDSLPNQIKEEKRSSFVFLTRHIWGSLDRFIALLLEHYEGVLPLWLAPEQVRVIAIGEANRVYAMQIKKSLGLTGLRVGLDIRQSKLGNRIHEAEKENVPYLVLVGEQERINKKICVRGIERFNQTQSIDLELFLRKIDEKSLCPKTTMLMGESESA